MTAWAAAPMKVDKTTARLFAENTMRQSARITLGGEKFTFTFSNEYCNSPLDIDAVYIAKQKEAGKSGIDAATNAKLTFGGSESVTVAAGETITSDPVDFSCAALQNIAVSIEFGANVPEMMTGHEFAASTCRFAEGKCGASEDMGKTRDFDYRYCLSKINVWNETGAGAIICFGDSITDGVGSDVDNYNNYPDLLANLMQSDTATANYSVVNSGIGGNKLSDSACAGTMGIIRFERDILDIEGAEYAIIFIGTNDIGGANPDTYDDMLAAYKKLVDECHNKNIKVYAATVTPLKLSGYDSDEHRQLLNELNTYLLSDESVFDGVMDFYSVIEDPNNPETVADEYNCP